MAKELNTWKNFDFKESRTWIISTHRNNIKVNDGEIIAIGLDLNGHGSGMMKLSIREGAEHYLTKKPHRSYSLSFLQKMLFQALFLPSQCIQQSKENIYVYTSDRAQVTEKLEDYMNLCGYTLESRSYIPEVIRGERWLEYKFKALYPIEKDE